MYGFVDYLVVLCFELHWTLNLVVSYVVWYVMVMEMVKVKDIEMVWSGVRSGK